MGTFYWPMTVSTVTGEGSREIETLVDTGATYSMVPENVLREIGIAPIRASFFQLADGSRERMQMGRMLVSIGGLAEICPVVFGPENARPLIGAVTLEALLLTVDPIKRRLVSTDGLLL
ncbi:MAG: hypothetical protein OXC99_10135 [Chloroflexi bacterium]|nr:hypothetical protein [Chloroflexota bacterium]